MYMCTRTIHEGNCFFEQKDKTVDEGWQGRVPVQKHIFFTIKREFDFCPSTCLLLSLVICSTCATTFCLKHDIIYKIVSEIILTCYALY